MGCGSQGNIVASRCAATGWQLGSLGWGHRGGSLPGKSLSHALQHCAGLVSTSGVPSLRVKPYLHPQVIPICCRVLQAY